MGFFALAGAAVFLTWPVRIGPPLLVLLVLALAREGSRRPNASGT
jgi:hypothetical protein